MSHTAPTTGRRSRTPDAPTPDAPTPDAPTPDATPDAKLTDAERAEWLARVGLLTPEELTETVEKMTDAEKAKIAQLSDAEITEAREIAKIGGFTMAPISDGDTSFKAATTPTRNRRPVQLAMDKVASRAYQDWIDAERPSTWSRMPVVTYFLDPEEVPEYRKLIRRACDAVPPQGDATGVRCRFGTEFVLSEKMAEKIKNPTAAGKTVLAWAAIDKRKVQARNGNSD